MSRYVWRTLFIILILFCLAGASALAEVSEDGMFSYTLSENENELCVVDYYGEDPAVVIPAELDGHPVTSIRMERNDTIIELTLPDTVKRIENDGLSYLHKLQTIHGLEYVEYLGERAFHDACVKELVFSEKLKTVSAMSFSSITVTKITIPDDIQINFTVGSSNIFANNHELRQINLINTGNTPTIIQSGLGLYTADMQTMLLCINNDCQMSYKVPDGVCYIASGAFCIEEGTYQTTGLLDIVLPSSIEKIYPNAIYTGLVEYNTEGKSSSECYLPHMHIQRNSYAEEYCQDMGIFCFTYDDINDAVTVESKISQILSQCIQPEMSEYEKALALHDWICLHSSYDDSFSYHSADGILLRGTGVCQSYMTAYQILLKRVGIDSECFVFSDFTNFSGHGLNYVRLNGKWCYIDCTWDTGEPGNGGHLYFGLNDEMAEYIYDIDINGALYRSGTNAVSIDRYYAVMNGDMDDLFQHFQNILDSMVSNGEKNYSINMIELESLMDDLATKDKLLIPTNYVMYILSSRLNETIVNCPGYRVVAEVQLDNGYTLSISIESGDALTDYQYTLYEDHAEIDRYIGTDSDVVIPNQIAGFPVTIIGYRAFASTNVAHVHLPQTITTLKQNAFLGCSELQEITLPESCLYFEDFCLSSCTSLTSVTFLGPVTTLSRGMFCDNYALTAITLPDTLVSIGELCFQNCTSLRQIVIPSGVSIISHSMLSSCTSLQDITFLGEITRIESSAFAGCTNWKKPMIPAQCTYIGDYAYYYCNFAQDIILPDTLITLGSTAIPLNQSNIHIPASLTNISLVEGSPIFDSNSLMTISVDERNPVFQSIDGCLYSRDGTKMMQCPMGRTGTIIVPEGVTDIGSAFVHCHYLNAIQLPSTLKQLESGAFDNCWALQYINIPEGISSLPFGLFVGDSSLRYVSLPSTLTSVGIYAFYGCGNGLDLVFPDTVADFSPDSLCQAHLNRLVLPRTVTSLTGIDLTGVVISHLYLHSNVTFLPYIDSPNMTVYGKPGSYAEEYALQHNYTFVPWNIEDDHQHTPTIIAGKEPTCTASGFSDSVVCSECQAVLIPASLQPAWGHDLIFEAAFMEITLDDPAVELYCRCSRKCGIPIEPTAWSVSDEDVVDGADGVYTPVAPGHTTIKCIVDDTEAKVDLFIHDTSPFTLPINIKTIDSEAFAGISAKDVVLPYGTEYIGSRAFADSQICIISIPETINFIADDAFDGCSSLSICGINDSFAYTYAMTHDIPFFVH